MAKKILVIEDHDDFRAILAVQLRGMGYEVLEAAAAAEGIYMALAESPDLIIMDLGLPGMNGIEASIQLKRNPKTARVPIVAYTVWDKEIFQDVAKRAGMVEYLCKPAPSELLREVVEKALIEAR